MRRTPYLLLAGALALALPLAACGGDDDTSTSTSSSAPAATDGEPTGAGGSITVLAEDQLTFDRDTYEVESGDITITYENAGSIDHTLLIKKTSFGKLSISGSGASATGTIDLAPGTYEMYCDIAGHTNMTADLVVE